MALTPHPASCSRRCSRQNTQRLAAATGLALLCWSVGIGVHAYAQTQTPPVYARVLDATPVYTDVARPQADCTTLQSQTRCMHTTVYESQLIGYDVLYEYAGQQHMQRMDHDPGVQVPVERSVAAQRYSSQPGADPSAVAPGRKTYGSAPTGAPVVDSIEWHGNDSPPVYVEVPAPAPPQRRPPAPPRPY